jgi:hypothetical protein
MIGIYRMVNQPYEYEAGMAHLTVGVLGVLCMNFLDDLWLNIVVFGFCSFKKACHFGYRDGDAPGTIDGSLQLVRGASTRAE